MSHFEKIKILGNNGTNWHEIKIDTSTRTLNTIDYTHHEIHDGNHFYIEGFLMLSSGQVHRVKLTTPDSTKWAHFRWDIQSTGILETTLYETASEGMLGGVSVTPLNSDRNSATTSGINLVSGVSSATGVGTLVSNRKWGAEGFKSNIGGGAGREDELILKQNEIYIRTFSSGAADNIVSFAATWYEHENKIA